MKTEVVSQEKNIIVLKAEFDAEQVNNAIDKTIKDLSKKANIKGFRKGHVPRRTIELYFGMKGICAEALEKIVPEAIDKMIEEYELNLIAEPRLEPGDLKEGEPFVLQATFEVTPDVTLPDIEAIEAEKTLFEATEEMRDENIVRLLESRSELAPTYEEREITGDDYVSVKYTSSVVDPEGNVSPVESDQKTEIHLGQQNMRPEVVEAIIGKKPADTATVEFSVEEDPQNKDLAGKKMRYEIEVLGIMKRITPELTDETVVEMTQSRHKTVDEFKEEVMSQLKAAAEQHSLDSLKDSAVRKLCDLSDVELPETLITRQKEAMKADQAQKIRKDSGMDMEEFFEKSGMDKESYENELDQAARVVVKRALVLEAIADANDIQWTPEELDAEINRLAISSRIDPKKLHDYIFNDRDRLFELAEKIRSRKAVDFLITKVKVRETEEDKTVSEEDKENK
ncbi:MULTISPECIES: trigger factor [Synergistaceae]|uniref:trigger factor n=1 Tax=Synergistaceae TaxID=649777 RepID=UPI003AE7FC48|nr:trigger factor [Synergistaceae bacterium DZ-S4]